MTRKKGFKTLASDYVIYYHNWARLAVLGIIPFVMLVYFNTKIYNDLQVTLGCHSI
jgi:hypothetical protein